MVNRDVNLPYLTIGDKLGSTQSPNKDGGDTGLRTVVTPSHRSSTPTIFPYFRVSNIQQLEPHNIITGPSIPRPMPQPSSIFSSLPPMIPSSSLYPSPPSLLPVQRSPNSCMPSVTLSPASFQSSSDYNPSLLPVERSPNSGMPPVSPLSASFRSSSHLTRSVSNVSWSMFTPSQINTIMGDKNLLELAASSLKLVKSKLANRASAARAMKKSDFNDKI